MAEIKTKTREELKKLNDRNLLALYRAERQRNYSFLGSHICNCCGEIMSSSFDSTYKYEDFKKEKKERHGYLSFIKSILDTRKHVEQPTKTKKDGNTNKTNKRRPKKG